MRFIVRGSRFQLDLELGRIPQPDEPDAPAVYDLSGAHLERAPAYDYEEPASVGRLGFQPNDRIQARLTSTVTQGPGVG